jgi:glycosyltransferase involved in cell wall biosynthesis
MNSPYVSVGLAVFNGEKFLDQAIKSILDQTFADFELIISDNTSTDRTPEICRNYADQDKRVRYVRNEVNIGGAANENQTFRLSKGKYFRWAAHDDICAPTLLEKCIKVLDENKSIILCHSMIEAIDENGKTLWTASAPQGTYDRAYQRFRAVSDHHGHNCEFTYGLIRSDALSKTRLQLFYTDSDRTLMSELCLMGKFYEIPEILFYKRFHPGNDVYRDWSGHMKWFFPNLKEKPVFPYCEQFVDYFVTIHRVQIAFYDRFRCYLTMTAWPFHNYRGIAREMIVAIGVVLKRVHFFLLDKTKKNE